MPGSHVLEAAAKIPVQSLDDNLHVASIVVHAQPAMLDPVSAWLEQQSGTEIYGRDDQGKLVVVIESHNSQDVLDVIDNVQLQPGVLNAALVYHELVPPEEDTP